MQRQILPWHVNFCIKFWNLIIKHSFEITRCKWYWAQNILWSDFFSHFFKYLLVFMQFKKSIHDFAWKKKAFKHIIFIYFLANSCQVFFLSSSCVERLWLKTEGNFQFHSSLTREIDSISWSKQKKLQWFEWRL